MKKIISVLLSLVLMLSLSAPAFAGEYDEKPTIYVLGARVMSLYAADGTKIFPVEDGDLGDIISEYLKPCLEELAKGILTRDYEKWAEKFHEAVMKGFDDIALDGSGEVTDGSHAEFEYNHYLPKKSSNYQVYDYQLCYDWRESPIKTAETLKRYIDDVKEATGESKVNLIGRCYGANVVQAYLTLYSEHAIANVDDVAYLSSSVLGIDCLGAIFSADIELEPKAVNNFVDYYMENGDLIEDSEMKELIMSAVDVFEYISVLGLTLDVCELFIDEVKDDIFPRVLLDTFGGYVSYWSMVPAEKYEEARDFLFKGLEDEYAGFIAKCDDYHYNVQLKAEETLKSLEAKGIDFYMVSKYDFPDVPVFEGATGLADGYTSVKRQSFGATCSEHAEVLSDKYIRSLDDTKYLSPDLQIDASTCLFPETSYFVKGIFHDTFPYAINKFAIDLMNNEATVSGGEYAQYMLYHGWSDPLTPIEGPDESESKKDEPMQNMFIRFFKSIFKLFLKLLKGEISLGA